MKNPVIRLDNGLPHRARKRFGQNFLHDREVIDRIVAGVAPGERDHVLEIGPGQGALTESLAERAGRLDCVELDRDLVRHLQQQYAGQDNVNIMQGDILRFDVAELTQEPHALRVIGNLPYNISTPVLFRLLDFHGLIRDMTFMLQLEVVQRMAAGPGDRNFGRLSLMLQYYCAVEHLFNVPSAAFTPRPRVSSAIVRLTPHREFPVVAEDPDMLETVIRAAFNQRRKTLKNSLRGLMSEVALRELPVNVGLRPEKLGLAEFVAISDALSRAGSAESRPQPP